MKQIFKTFMIVAALTATTSSIYAQDNNRNYRQDRPSPEQMIEQQANSIANQLGLNAKTSKKFLSVYKSQHNDMMQLMPRGGGMPPKGERQQGDRTQQRQRPQGERPSGRPQMSEANQKKMASLKEKYDKKYSKFLSQSQIEQMYKIQEQERSKRSFGSRR